MKGLLLIGLLVVVFYSPVVFLTTEETFEHLRDVFSKNHWFIASSSTFVMYVGGGYLFWFWASLAKWLLRNVMFNNYGQQMCMPLTTPIHCALHTDYLELYHKYQLPLTPAWMLAHVTLLLAFSSAILANIVFFGRDEENNKEKTT